MSHVIVRTAVSEKSKKTALLCCIFGGIFGLHQFYVGKTTAGFGYLITLACCGLLVVLDIFKILFGFFTDKYGAPLKIWKVE